MPKFTEEVEVEEIVEKPVEKPVSKNRCFCSIALHPECPTHSL